MDTVKKLETKWPPDRKSTIEASEFGIYKEPSDGKQRLRGTDRATGCLLVLSLIAAAGVVMYFTFFDYTIQTTHTVASVGPIVSYAKYVKDKHSTSTAATVVVDRAADELLAAVLSAKHSEDHGTSAADVTVTPDGTANWAADVTTNRAADVTTNGAADVTANRAADVAPNRAAADDGFGGRRMRLYRPLAKHLSYDSDYWKTDGDAERADGFDRRSDFPQLAAYRAPFPPKSMLDVMKYVTGSSHRPPAAAAAGGHEYMMAQESRYVPIRPAEEVNRFLPDADAPPASGSKRFRNKFGPPVFLTPPMMAFPDDFMKPPSPGARFSMDFETAAADAALQEGSASVPSHTGVVFHQSAGITNSYPVPDAPSPAAAVAVAPKRVKNGKAKNKKPISVMVDIYPLTDREHDDIEQVEDDDEDRSSEMFSSFKNNVQLSDAEKLLLRLNLFPNFNEGGRRNSIGLKHEEQEDDKPIINLTTHKALGDKEDENNENDEIFFENEYKPESKTQANISKIK